MNLYRIRNKNTGLFFYAQINPKHEGQWGPSGIFWKKIDTAKKHIDWLMHEWVVNPDCKGPWSKSWWKRGRYFHEREGVFEVVVSNVTLNGEYAISAEDLLEINEKSNAQLFKGE